MGQIGGFTKQGCNVPLTTGMGTGSVFSGCATAAWLFRVWFIEWSYVRTAEYGYGTSSHPTSEKRLRDLWQSTSGDSNAVIIEGFDCSADRRCGSWATMTKAFRQSVPSRLL